jgi:hypothetical protein
MALGSEILGADQRYDVGFFLFYEEWLNSETLSWVLEGGYQQW